MYLLYIATHVPIRRYCRDAVQEPARMGHEWAPHARWTHITLHPRTPLHPTLHTPVRRSRSAAHTRVTAADVPVYASFVHDGSFGVALQSRSRPEQRLRPKHPTSRRTGQAIERIIGCSSRSGASCIRECGSSLGIRKRSVRRENRLSSSWSVSKSQAYRTAAECTPLRPPGGCGKCAGCSCRGWPRMFTLHDNGFITINSKFSTPEGKRTAWCRTGRARRAALG